MRKILLALALFCIFGLNIGGGALWIADGWGITNITNGTVNNTKEYPYLAPAIAIGDADNDGLNETVIGYSNMTNELRMYNKTGGVWTETNISDEPSAIKALAIGDFDKDGKNSIVIGLYAYFGQDITSSIRAYDNISGGWFETNITTIDNNVTTMVYGDVNNNGIMDITVGFDQYTYNNTRFYENKTGGWIEQNISDNYGYDVVAMDVGRTRATTRNKTVIGLSGAAFAVRKYENTTGKWAEYNFTATAVYNGSTPSTPGAIRIGDLDNDGYMEVHFSEVHYALGVYTSSMYKFSNPSGNVWMGVMIYGGITAPIPLIEIGKVNGNVNNSLYFSVSNTDLKRIELVSGTWIMTSLSGGDLISQNAWRIGDADNNGVNEIYVASTTLGVPYNVYRIFKYYYTTPSAGGVATDLFCVAMGKDKKFCSSDSNDYLCIKDNCVVI